MGRRIVWWVEWLSKTESHIFGIETKIQREGYEQLSLGSFVHKDGREFIKLDNELVDLDRYIATTKNGAFAQILKSWRLDRVRVAQVVSENRSFQ